MALAHQNCRSIRRDERRGLWQLSSLLFLLLSFSVFLWGTAYKLSLYKHDASTSLAPAKLCKLSSDNAKNQADNAVGVQPTHGHRFSPRPSAVAPPSITTEIPAVLLSCSIETDVWDGFVPLRAAPVLHVRPPPYLSQRIFS